MSAERLALGDLVRCSRCRKWHAAEIWASGSSTDDAETMLFIHCGSSDRPGIDDVGTASVTAAAKQVLLTRLNVLVIGPVVKAEATVSAIVVALEKPAYFWAPDVPLPPRTDGRAIVIRDIGTLSPALQQAWLAWLTAQPGRGPHIIATSSIPVFPLVTQGMFRVDLYYRLNAIDLSAPTDND